MKSTFFNSIPVNGRESTRNNFLPLILLLFTAFQSAGQYYSGTASPYPVNIVQPDGSILAVLGSGDKNFHYATTSDGYPILKNENGIYEYGNLIGRDSFVLTGIKAHNVNNRSESEIVFLKNLQKPTSQQNVFKSLKSVNLQGSRPELFPVTGNQKVLVLLIRFTDLDSTFSTSAFIDFMNKSGYNGTGSFRDYFLAASAGKLTLNVDISGWYKAAHDYRYYGEATGNDHTRDLVIEAVDAAEKAGVDFSLYDNNKDGEVDNLIVIHSGPGAEEASQNEYIWSHSWGLVTKARVYDKVKIDSYTIQPETRVYGMVGIGTFCHEFGHALGFPDLYDTDDSNGKSMGLGRWCLMAAGSWLNKERTPAMPCAFLKEKAGWINPVNISVPGKYSLSPAASGTDCYRITTKNTWEYFLLENRFKTGFDAALPGSGLAIYHINTYRQNNNDESAKLVDLEEADGLTDLDDNINTGDTGDLFPGATGNNSFNDLSNPGSLTNDKEKTGTDLRAIALEGDQVRFRIGEIPVNYNPPAYSDNNSGLRVFPNPCRDFLNIQFNQSGKGNLLEIISSEGKVFHCERIPSSGPDNIKRLDLRFLKDGFYLIRIQTEKGIFTNRFVFFGKYSECP